MSDDQGTQQLLPQYQCHKKVRALKIKNIAWEHGIAWNAGDAGTPPMGDILVGNIIPTNPNYVSIPISAAYVEKHRPQRGGYYVLYADGYKSYSPADVFEAGYTALK